MGKSRGVCRVERREACRVSVAASWLARAVVIVVIAVFVPVVVLVIVAVVVLLLLLLVVVVACSPFRLSTMCRVLLTLGAVAAAVFAGGFYAAGH